MLHACYDNQPMARRAARVPWQSPHVLDCACFGCCATHLEQCGCWIGGIDDDLHYLCYRNFGKFGPSVSALADGSQNWLVRSASEVEQNIVSVERVLGYGSLPSEAAEDVPEKKPPKEWPQQGAIEFEYGIIDFTLRLG